MAPLNRGAHPTRRTGDAAGNRHAHSGPSWSCSTLLVFTSITPHRALDLTEIYQNPEWGLRQRDKALRGMHYFDGVLKKQPFVAGEAFSMADITVIGGLVFAALVDLPIPAQCKALQAWHARTQERPSVKNWVTMSEPTETSL